ncbi:hypothetical protein [Liquorilactobacillus vini]|uniref:Uncharacterized protein n=1 Tax=Liquorilactobacillus vini DSM 20605 TaxID=1133569 RepID=A0A0R2CKK5_9LACO|nr:hypothetical protein [Liquorilactobacillus vini]KRM88780.1 hypothetical protein FD21_GL000794 [Liquorilactobacillus vini DSM 20605]
MRVHTLGPAETDSNQAAQYFVANLIQEAGEIILHPSFEQLFVELPQLAGDYLLIPTAFRSSQLNLSWGQWHYRNLNQLTLKNAFIFPLAPLVLLENTQNSNNLADTHAALADLLSQIIPTAQINCSASKYLAYQKYRLTDSRYVLTNQRLVQIRPFERIIKKFEPQMIWAVYHIKGELTNVKN